MYLTDEGAILAGVFLGGKEARARYRGRGQTNGDAVVYFPAIRTPHTGDPMSGTSPPIDYPGGAQMQWGLPGMMRELKQAER